VGWGKAGEGRVDIDYCLDEKEKWTVSRSIVGSIGITKTLLHTFIAYY
jgi:hypothetical protein